MTKLTVDDLTELLNQIQSPEQREVALRISRLYRTILEYSNSVDKDTSPPESSTHAHASEEQLVSPRNEPKSTLGVILAEGPEDKCAIHQLVPGSPAHSCDELRQGDIVLTVDGTEVDRNSVVRRMRGNDIPGTHVKLQISRLGQRSFEVTLLRDTKDVVVKQNALHEKMVELGRLATAPTDQATESQVASLVNEGLTLMKQLNRIRMEKDSVLVADAQRKDNAIRMIQEDLAELVVRLVETDKDGNSDGNPSFSQLAADSAEPPGDLHQELMAASRRIQQLNREMENAHSVSRDLEQKLRDVEEQNNHLQLSLASASSDYRRINAELRLLHEELLHSRRAASGDPEDPQAQGHMYQRIEKQWEEERRRERESVKQTLTEVIAKHKESDNETEQLREDLRKARTALDASKEREWELQLSLSRRQASGQVGAAGEQSALQIVGLASGELFSEESMGRINQHLAQRNLKLTRVDEANPLDDRAVNSQIQDALEALSEANDRLRQQEDDLSAITRLLEAEQIKVVQARAENARLTQQLQERVDAASESSAPSSLLTQFEERLADLENQSAREAVELEQVVNKLTVGMSAVEFVLDDLTARAWADRVEEHARATSAEEAYAVLEEEKKRWNQEKGMLCEELKTSQARHLDAVQRTTRLVEQQNVIQASVVDKDAQLQDLAAQAAAMAARHEAAEGAVSQARLEKEALERKLAAMAAQMELLRGQVDVLESQQGQAQRLEEELKAARLQSGVLEDQLAILRSHAEQQAAELETKSERGQSLLQFAQAAQHKAEEVERHKADFAQQTAEAERRVSELQTACDVARQKQEDFAQQAAVAERRVSELQAECDGGRQKQEETEKTLISTTHERDLAAAANEKLRASLEEAEQQLRDKVRSSEELTRLLHQAEEALGQAETEVAKGKQLEKERDSLALEVAALTAAVSATTTERHVVVDESAARAKSTASDQSQTELTACKEKNKDLQERLDAVEVTNRMLLSTQQEQAKHTRRLDLEVQQQVKLIQSLEAEKASLAAGQAVAVEDIAALRQRNSQVELELQKAVGLQLDSLDARLVNVDGGVRTQGEEELRERLRVAEDRSRELEAHLEAFKVAAGGGRSAPKARPFSVGDMNQMQDKVTALEEAMRAERSNYESSLQRLRSERDRLAHRVAQNEAASDHPPEPAGSPPANTRDVDLGSLFQKFFATKSEPNEPPEPPPVFSPRGPHAALATDKDRPLPANPASFDPRGRTRTFQF